MMPEVGGAFDEEKTFLRNKHGAPKAIKSKSMLIYDSTLPNIIVVQTTDKTKGLGVLAVRYYDPVVR